MAIELLNRRSADVMAIEKCDSSTESGWAGDVTSVEEARRFVSDRDDGGGDNVYA